MAADDSARDCVAAALHRFAAGCVVASLDTDDQLDVAMGLEPAGSGRFAGTISIHLSNGKADQHLALPHNGQSVFGLFARDVDGDGDLDIALTGGGNQTLGVYLNDGSGQFKFDESDSYITEPNTDFYQLAPVSRHNPEFWLLAKRGTSFSPIPAIRSCALASSTVLLRTAQHCFSFRYAVSGLRIRAP